MTKVPNVLNEVELPVLNHVFRLKRLRWIDMPPVNKWITEHKMVDRLAITAHALYEISGRPITPDEALKVLTSLPKSVLSTVYKFYKGSLDPHRMFETSPLWKAPDATEFRQQLDDEEHETDSVMDEVEELLTQKFGQKAVEEEKELVRQMVKSTGYAGAMKLEEDHMERAISARNDREEW